MSRPRLGLVGFNCHTGLGEMSRQICAHLPVDYFLVKPRLGTPTLPDLPNVDHIHCPMGVRVEEFVKLVDVIIFCETPYYNDLTTLCKKHGKKSICVPMQEWMPEDLSGWPSDVDLFICPNLYCYQQFSHKLPCIHFPWPVDTERFDYVHRQTCQQFLFLNGNGGWRGRKGADVIIKAKKLWPAFPVVVRSQCSFKWSGLEMLPTPSNNSNLYSVGDVLICPHHLDGLCLEPFEAMSCGIPVVLSQGGLWDEIQAIGRIRTTQRYEHVRREVTWFDPSAKDLVSICKYLLGQPLSGHSYQARSWVEERSWTSKAKDLESLIFSIMERKYEPVHF